MPWVRGWVEGSNICQNRVTYFVNSPYVNYFYTYYNEVIFYWQHSPLRRHDDQEQASKVPLSQQLFNSFALAYSLHNAI